MNLTLDMVDEGRLRVRSLNMTLMWYIRGPRDRTTHI